MPFESKGKIITHNTEFKLILYYLFKDNETGSSYFRDKDGW